MAVRYARPVRFLLGRPRRRRAAVAGRCRRIGPARRPALSRRAAGRRGSRAGTDGAEPAGPQPRVAPLGARPGRARRAAGAARPRGGGGGPRSGRRHRRRLGHARAAGAGRRAAPPRGRGARLRPQRPPPRAGDRRRRAGRRAPRRPHDRVVAHGRGGPRPVWITGRGGHPPRGRPRRVRTRRAGPAAVRVAAGRDRAVEAPGAGAGRDRPGRRHAVGSAPGGRRRADRRERRPPARTPARACRRARSHRPGGVGGPPGGSEGRAGARGRAAPLRRPRAVRDRDDRGAGDRHAGDRAGQRRADRDRHEGRRAAVPARRRGVGGAGDRRVPGRRGDARARAAAGRGGLRRAHDARALARGPGQAPPRPGPPKRPVAVPRHGHAQLAGRRGAPAALGAHESRRGGDGRGRRLRGRVALGRGAVRGASDRAGQRRLRGGGEPRGQGGRAPTSRSSSTPT